MFCTGVLYTGTSPTCTATTEQLLSVPVCLEKPAFIKINQYSCVTLLLKLAINPCSEHLCTQLCLLSGLRPRYYSCHCQSGWKLDADKRTCIKGMLFLLPNFTLLNICSVKHINHYSVKVFFSQLEMHYCPLCF